MHRYCPRGASPFQTARVYRTSRLRSRDDSKPRSARATAASCRYWIRTVDRNKQGPRRSLKRDQKCPPDELHFRGLLKSALELLVSCGDRNEATIHSDKK